MVLVFHKTQLPSRVNLKKMPFLRSIIDNLEISKVLNSLVHCDNDLVLVVGGVVRDFIQTGFISTDVDIATSLSVDVIVDRLSLLPDAAVVTYAVNYGSVTVMKNGYEFTVTTFRKDKETFGRHAVVESVSSIEEDAKRRDFTMNAVYIDINGKLYDFFNGVEDILSGNIRFIGKIEDRIREDYLRILRFFRFSAKYSDTYDSSVLDVLRTLIDGVKQLSSERITKELIGVLGGKFFVSAFKNMEKIGLLSTLFCTDKVGLLDYKILENFTSSLGCIEDLLYKYSYLNKKYRIGSSFFFSGVMCNGSNDITKIKSKFSVDRKYAVESVKLIVLLLSCKTRATRLFILKRLKLSKLVHRAVMFAVNNSDVVFCRDLTDDLKRFIVLNCNKKDVLIPMMMLNQYCGARCLEFLCSLKALPLKTELILQNVSIEQSRINELLSMLMQLWALSDFTLSSEDLLRAAKSFTPSDSL